MRRSTVVRGAVAVIVLAGASVLGLELSARHSFAPTFRYEVSITNLTRGQIFSPAVVATHSSGLAPLFMGGHPASDELAAVAEDAVLEPLMEALQADEAVADVQVLTGAGGPILPGETATVDIGARRGMTEISLVGMLVTTNDGFYGVSGRSGPVRGGDSLLVPAYDAGSEANNELCSHVPGPPCGSAGVRDTDGAEGYVHIHAGIHGGGDLDASEHDWRNPVARVTIRRVHR